MQTSIESFLNRMKVERQASAHTLRSYADDLRTFVRYLEEIGGAGLQPSGIDAKVLRRYTAWLNTQGYAATTIARRLACLRSFFKHLRREEILSADPSAGLRNPRQPKRLPRCFSVEEVIRLLDSIDLGSDAGLRDRAMLEVLYGGGLRVSELMGLDLVDLDFETELVLVRGKGRRERLSPVGKMAMECVRHYLTVRRPRVASEPALFLNRFGRRLTTRSVGRLLEAHLIRAGLIRNSITAMGGNTIGTGPKSLNSSGSDIGL